MKKQVIISSLNALEQGAPKSAVVRHLEEEAHIQVRSGITRRELKEALQEKVRV